MLIELKEFELQGNNIFACKQFPEDGMYLVVDGIATFIVSVSKKTKMCCSVPVPLEMVKRYEVEKAEEKIKGSLSAELEVIQQKLDEIIDLAKEGITTEEDGLPTIHSIPYQIAGISEAGLIDLVKAIKDK